MARTSIFRASLVIALAAGVTIEVLPAQ